MTAPATYVILDTETTSLDVDRAVPVEIAAMIYRPRAPGVAHTVITNFVPFHAQDDLARAEPEALTVNRYFERRLWERVETGSETARLRKWLHAEMVDATLVCANPHYDAQILARWFDRDPDLTPEPWHYRLFDIQAATAGRFGLPKPPSLIECARLFGVPVDEKAAHTALGDVHVAFKILQNLIGLAGPRHSASVTR